MTNVVVTGLAKMFGTVTAVDRISFEVKAGQFVTLLGPSGCGKTTTLRMIAGLERPSAGEIRVGDRVLYSTERRIFVPPERRAMGMVFQSYAIWPHMTVFENVAFPLREKRRPKNEIRERVMNTLQLVGLSLFAERPAPMLSGGQQQRVALARALVCNPQVLLLDEPLSNLDARLREQMRFEIRSMQVRLGITTIFVTHDQLEAMTLSDHIMVMNAGTIEQRGAPEDVYERPTTRYVMDFLGQVNYLPTRIQRVGGALQAVIGESGFALPEGDWQEGEEAVLAVRSEAVQLAPNGGQMSGTVATSTYVGGGIEYLIRVGDGQLRLLGPSEPRLAVGSSVHLNIAPTAVRVWRTHDARTSNGVVAGVAGIP
jgi:iron(III) transport system ATP-binding protein